MGSYYTIPALFAIIAAIFSMNDEVIGCNKGYHHHGWGEPVIILPKPTLFPKLKHAFYEGKALVDYHKIIAPSLKPLPYKKGLGFIGKGWLPLNALHHGHGHHGGHHGGFHHEFGFGIGKAGLVGVKGEIGYGKGLGWAPVGPIGPLLHGHHGGHGLHGGHGGFGGHGGHGGFGGGHGHGLHGGHGGFGGGHGGFGGHGHHAVTPIPLGVGHHHTVSHNAVTVVEKGSPHIAPPFPHNPQEFGKK